jgi:hypothetical protein
MSSGKARFASACVIGFPLGLSELFIMIMGLIAENGSSGAYVLLGLAILLIGALLASKVMTVG